MIGAQVPAVVLQVGLNGEASWPALGTQRAIADASFEALRYAEPLQEPQAIVGCGASPIRSSREERFGVDCRRMLLTTVVAR